MVSEFEFVDLFAGAGGLDLAARGLGVPGVGIEWDAGVCATRRAAELVTIEGDVRAFAPHDFPSANVLVGGPPCQAYTVAGSGAGRRALDIVLRLVRLMADREDTTASLAEVDDERGYLVLEPLRWALAAADSGRPYEVVVLAQEPTVMPVWKAVREVLSAEGYSAVCGVLRAEEFGIPQTRRYAVLIARRRGTAALPKATHQPYRKNANATPSNSTLPPCVTMGETLDRPKPFVVVSNYGSGGDPRARARRTSAEPAFTVTGKIFRSRIMTEDGADLGRLSPSEAGQLQGFPAYHPWAARDVARQIGNAVPPLLAEHIFRAALDHGH